MAYFVCLGREERYGNMAIPSGGTHIYRGFRFRDPWCVDTGRTRNKIASASFSEWVTTVVSKHVEDLIEDYRDAEGLVWRWRTDNKPDDHQFSRRPWDKIIDNRRDSAWQFGTQTKAKQNPPVSTNEGYYVSSTWKILKERGILG